MLTGTSPSGELTSHVITGMLTSLITTKMLTSPGGEFTSHVNNWNAYFSYYIWNA